MEGYGPSALAISSPIETPNEYTLVELARVPVTLMRFVNYHKLNYHTSRRRGCLDEESYALADCSVADLPIGGSHTMFQNIVFEALSFISAYYAGLLCLNDDSGSLRIPSGSIVVGTIIYLNDILLPFINYRSEICSRKEVWENLCLPCDCDLEQDWVIGTPETLSGDTHLLTQVVILPQSVHRANLFGNLKSKGRRPVSYSVLGNGFPPTCVGNASPVQIVFPRRGSNT